mgnify:FL=1
MGLEKKISVSIEFTLTEKTTLVSTNKRIRLAFKEAVQNRQEYFPNGRKGMDNLLDRLDHFMELLIEDCDDQIKLMDKS